MASRVPMPEALERMGSTRNAARAYLDAFAAAPAGDSAPHALLRLVRQVGRKIPQGVLIDLPLSRQDLAEMTGTTLYTVSPILSGWERAGLVDAGRGGVIDANLAPQSIRPVSCIRANRVRMEPMVTIRPVQPL